MLIGKFAERVGLSVDTLRYYEKIGLMPPVDRMPSGRRNYSSDHIAWVEFLNVLKTTGMGVNDMSRYVELRSKGLASLQDRQDLLIKHLQAVIAKRKEIEEMETVLREKTALFQSVLDGKRDGQTLACATGVEQ